MFFFRIFKVFALIICIALVSLTPIGYIKSFPFLIQNLSELLKSCIKHLTTGKGAILWYPVTSGFIIAFTCSLIFNCIKEYLISPFIDHTIKGQGNIGVKTFLLFIISLVLLIGWPWLLASVIWTRMWIWKVTGGL